MQKETKTTAQKTVGGILGDALTRFVEIDTSISTQARELIKLDEKSPELTKAIRQISDEFAKADTWVAKSYAKSVVDLGQKLELANTFLQSGPAWTFIPAGLVSGVAQSVLIPGQITTTILSSMKTAMAVPTGKTGEERQKLIEKSILPIATMSTGMVAWFAGRPQAVATSPFEAGLTVGMLLGPEKIYSMARALKVKIDPSGLSNTGLALEIDVNRIEKPKGLSTAQSTEWIGEIQRRVVEGYKTLLRENKDVIIHDP